MSRDRGASYLRGATKGAPQAQQVLDRWHVLKNLGEVLQKILGQQAEVLHQAADEAAPATFCQPLSAASSPPGQSRSTGDEGMEQEKKHPPAVIVPPTPAPRARKPPRRKPATLSKQRQWQLEMYQKVHERFCWGLDPGGHCTTTAHRDAYRGQISAHGARKSTSAIIQVAPL